ncbi:MAG: hypothetical protein KAW09_07570 [Thermoplasmata archaeon]|nr:hypothetical protein [Thermoplasmata archaeon]
MTREEAGTTLWRFTLGYLLGFAIGLLVGVLISWAIEPAIVMGFGLGFSLGIIFSQTRDTPLKTKIVRITVGVLILTDR